MSRLEVLRDGLLQSSVYLTKEQQSARLAILKNAITVVDGTAGSGKTFMALYTAIELLNHPKFQDECNCWIKKIIVIVPIPDNDELGYLRGTLEEKIEPRVSHIKKMLEELTSSSDYKNIMANRLEFLAVSHVRGRTFENCIAIVDEAQNLTSNNIKLMITRLGKKSKLVMCGDSTQIDLKDAASSGYDFIKGLNGSIEGYSVATLTNNNRHPIVGKFLHFFSY